MEYALICEESRKLVGLTQDDERVLRQIEPLIVPELDRVTTRFYDTLASVPSTARFIEGRTEQLRKTHRIWLESLFTRSVDAEYTRWMYEIGSIHVKVNLPSEFMASGMALVQRELLTIIAAAINIDIDLRTRACAAVAAICGFCQLVMQKSYAQNRSEDELSRYLRITGVSRPLYEKLSAAFQD